MSDGNQSDDRDMIEVPESELYDIYSTLMRATEAAASGDPNQCSMLASTAKDDLADLYEDYA